MTTKDTEQFIREMFRIIDSLQRRIANLESTITNPLGFIIVSGQLPGALTDSIITPKQLVVRRLREEPTSGAYIAFQNNPGSEYVFYLMLEDT